MLRNRIVTLALTVITLGGTRAGADEGLWLFNDFPANRVEAKYGFQVTQEFLDRVRLASTRLYPYGSGSFVSPNGLVFTNHHVAADCIQKLTTAANNYMRDGFHAAEPSDEKACPDLEINILTGIQDVTARVKGAVPDGASPTEANTARKAEMTRIEQACREAGGDRCDVETLYSGGQFHLYRYKKYTDVRLVFAPESAIASFGGDPDNFTYPRYCLDFTFFRVYENGRPASTPNYLKFSPKGVREGELTFVSGHPGTTGRLLTYAALEFYRDIAYPLVLRRTETYATSIEEFATRSERNRRVAAGPLQSWQNSRKAYRGFLRGLRDPRLMQRKHDEENSLRATVQADPKLRAEYGGIWDEIAGAYNGYAAFYKPHFLLETSGAGPSDLLRLARRILRYAEEKTKPNEDRLREYVDSNLPTIEQEIFSPAPIDLAFEEHVLAAHLGLLAAELGAGHPVVKAMLAGRSPAAAAKHYVSTSKLTEVGVRKRLAASVAAVRESRDGMIVLARLMDEPARQIRKRHEDEVESVLRDAAAKVGQAQFAVAGTESYPDATFTLRIGFGPVRGYTVDGRAVPFTTRIGGVFERATGEEPYKLPPSWLKAKQALDPGKQFNYVTTNDTHGGNSGSPTINTRGEVVGILFDGNIESLPNRFVYTDEVSRSVHVSTEVIVEALEKIYGAKRLLKELGVE